MKGIYKCILIVFIVSLIPSFTFAQKKQESIDVQRIWAFGFAENMNDTLVYLSPVQELEGAELQKGTNFLMFREDYALQIKQKLESTYPGSYITSIIFAQSKDKAEKKYLKVRRELRQRPQTLLIELNQQEFQFRKR